MHKRKIIIIFIRTEEDSKRKKAMQLGCQRSHRGCRAGNETEPVPWVSLPETERVCKRQFFFFFLSEATKRDHLGKKVGVENSTLV